MTTSYSFKTTNSIIETQINKHMDEREVDTNDRAVPGVHKNCIRNFWIFL